MGAAHGIRARFLCLTGALPPREARPRDISQPEKQGVLC